MDKMGIQIDLIDNSMKDATDGMINKVLIISFIYYRNSYKLLPLRMM